MNDAAGVMEAERRRAAAVVAGDLAAVEACLHPELVYVHATGTVHDRARLLAYLRTGPRFHEIRLEPRSVRLHANVALVFGDLHLRLQRAGEAPVQAHSLATAVWICTGTDWRLASFHSTRPP